MPRSLIALGANLGDPSATLEAAMSELRAQDDLNVLAASDWLRTTPVGGPAGQPDFLNGAALVEGSLTPHELVERLKQIESRHGRERRERWAARTLDLDLLLHGDVVLNDPALTLPHPRMSFRPFVLEPAAQIADEMRHPVLGSTVEHLLERLRSASPLLAILATTHAEREAVASALVASFPDRLRRVDLPKRQRVDAHWLAVGDAEPTAADAPKLSIVVGAPAPHALGGPTLWLTPEQSAADRRREQAAAVECVWPGLG